MASGQDLLTSKIERFNRLVDKATGGELIYLDICKASDKNLNICYVSVRMEVCVLGN